MTEELLGIAAKALLPLAGAVGGHLQKLRAERQAAVGGFPGPVADGVAAVVGRLAPRASRAEDMAQMVTLLLRAVAHRAMDDWTDWLDGKFAELARALPVQPSDGLNEFIALLRGLEVVLPIECWFHLRAKRVAATRR